MSRLDPSLARATRPGDTSEPSLSRYGGPPAHAPVTLGVEHLSVDVLTADGWCTVVDDVSFEVCAGETLGIVGESGSGKTVSCLAVAGLLPSKSTRVRADAILLKGRDLTTLSQRQLADVRGREMSMIFQEPMTSLNPAFTVGDQIGEVRRRHQGASRREAREAAVRLLDRVGVPNAQRRIRQYPFEFSGGMRQRVMIAMALACNPSLLIADEPTTALDVTVQAQILELIRELQCEERLSVLFITHDLGVVADVCERVQVMYAGQIIEAAPIFDLFAHPKHPYTEGLLRSVPRIDTAEEPLVSIGGSPPAVGEFPPACRFEPRCRYAGDDCRRETPVLDPVDGHLTRCMKHPELELEGVP